MIFWCQMKGKEILTGNEGAVVVQPILSELTLFTTTNGV